MKLSDNYRKLLVEEISTIRKLISEEHDFRKQLYYYSATYGITDRIMKLEYNTTLNFMDFVFKASYNAINGRVIAIRSGDTVVPIDNDFFKRMDKILHDLEKALKTKQDENIYKIMERIICLTSITLGPQYYLIQKGIKVTPD